MYVCMYVYNIHLNDKLQHNCPLSHQQLDLSYCKHYYAHTQYVPNYTYLKQ